MVAWLSSHNGKKKNAKTRNQLINLWECPKLGLWLLIFLPVESLATKTTTTTTITITMMWIGIALENPKEILLRMTR